MSKFKILYLEKRLLQSEFPVKAGCRLDNKCGVNTRKYIREINAAFETSLNKCIELTDQGLRYIVTELEESLCPRMDWACFWWRVFCGQQLHWKI